jgi:hypothetical protein
MPMRGPVTTSMPFGAAASSNGGCASEAPFSARVTPSAWVSLPGPEHSSHSSLVPRRSRISSSPATGSSARISTPAPCPSSLQTKFRHQWMP